MAPEVPGREPGAEALRERNWQIVGADLQANLPMLRSVSHRLLFQSGINAVAHEVDDIIHIAAEEVVAKATADGREVHPGAITNRVRWRTIDAIDAARRSAAVLAPPPSPGGGPGEDESRFGAHPQQTESAYFETLLAVRREVMLQRLWEALSHLAGTRALNADRWAAVADGRSGSDAAAVRKRRERGLDAIVGAWTPILVGHLEELEPGDVTRRAVRQLVVELGFDTYTHAQLRAAGGPPGVDGAREGER